jgi:hypothetical protein
MPSAMSIAFVWVVAGRVRGSRHYARFNYLIAPDL